jgi:hypothetical protein
MRYQIMIVAIVAWMLMPELLGVPTSTADAQSA